MKKVLKSFAILLVFVCTFLFVACSNDSDDDDESVVFTREDSYDGYVATRWVYEQEEKNGTAYHIITCYKDNTFTWKLKAGWFEETCYEGSYSGDTEKDGKIQFKLERIAKCLYYGWSNFYMHED